MKTTKRLYGANTVLYTSVTVMCPVPFPRLCFLLQCSVKLAACFGFGLVILQSSHGWNFFLLSHTVKYFLPLVCRYLLRRFEKVRELKAKNQQLQKSIPSIEKTMEEARKQQRLENENRQLKVQVEYLEKDLSWERGISARLQEGIGAVLDFLDRHLPEQFRPLVEKARELLPVPEVQQPEREQERGHTWGGMEL